MTIPPAAIGKIEKLIPLLASNHDGEVVATARAIQRVLESAGSSLHEMAGALQSPPPSTLRRAVRSRRGKAEPPVQSPVPFEDVLKWAPYLVSHAELTDREREFVVSLHGMADKYSERFVVTEKQAKWWLSIFDTKIIRKTA